MKAIVQRVLSAKLSVNNQPISQIGSGMVIFLGIESGDSKGQADYLAKKILNMRIFNDKSGKMNLSVLNTGGDILLVSQFTLCADLSQGNRPSFIFAEEPVRANELYEYVHGQLKAHCPKIKTGVFGAEMIIEQINDGPVTIIFQN